MVLVSPRQIPTRGVPADVFCPGCGYHLEPWEVHMLKWLDCPLCGAQLELGLTLEVAVVE